jgi:hypothetical protein
MDDPEDIRYNFACSTIYLMLTYVLPLLYGGGKVVVLCPGFVTSQVFSGITLLCLPHNIVGILPGPH